MHRVLIAIALLLAPVSILSGCAMHSDSYSDTPGEYYVFFETNSADLTPDGYAIVQRAAEGVAKLRPQGVVIAGYSDRVGSEAANHHIAANRTAIVQKTLIDLGVPVTIITTLPLGPASDDLGPTGDRRIEITLIKDNSEAPGPASGAGK